MRPYVEALRYQAPSITANPNTIVSVAAGQAIPATGSALLGALDVTSAATLTTGAMSIWFIYAAAVAYATYVNTERQVREAQQAGATDWQIAEMLAHSAPP